MSYSETFDSLNKLFDVDSVIGTGSGQIIPMEVGSFYGKYHTEETKKQIAQKLTGVKQSSQTIAKRVEKNKGQKRSPEQRRRMSEGCRHDPISFVNTDGTIVTTSLVAEFCRQYDLDHTNITKVIKGKRTTHKGWRKM